MLIAKVRATWAAGAGGTVPAVIIDMTAYKGRWMLYSMATTPGAAAEAPTDNYDVTVKANGLDILGGAGSDRDTANYEMVAPKINGIEMPFPIMEDTLTLGVTGNSSAAATGIVDLILVG